MKIREQKESRWMTAEEVKLYEPCVEGWKFFLEHFPNGGEYQDILDKCSEYGRLDWVEWLLKEFRRTDDVRIYEEPVIDPSKTIVFAGRLIFKHDVHVRRIITGHSIKAEGNLKVARDLFAGSHVTVEGNLTTGDRVTVEGNLSVGGNVKTYDGIITDFDLNVGGNITAISGLWIDGNLRVGGRVLAGYGIDVAGDLDVSGNVKTRGTISVYGNFSCAGEIKAQFQSIRRVS